MSHFTYLPRRNPKCLLCRGQRKWSTCFCHICLHPSFPLHLHLRLERHGRNCLESWRPGARGGGATLGSAALRPEARGACPKGVRRWRGARPGGTPWHSAGRRAAALDLEHFFYKCLETWSVAWRCLELALVWVLGLCWRRLSFGV